MRPSLLLDLATQESLRVQPRERSDVLEPLPHTAYWTNVSGEIRNRLGGQTAIMWSVNQVPGIWISFNINEDLYWLVFDRDQLRLTTGREWLGWVAASLMLALLGAAISVRFINQPLAQLAKVAQQQARGETPTPLPEKGPVEIRDMNIAFNRMARDLRQNEADVGHEDVAQPPDRLDEDRLGGVGLDQLAQPRDLDVQAAVEGFVFAAPGQFHELVARQRDLGVTGEDLEHGEFAGGDGHGFAVARQGAGGQVQHVGAEFHGFVFLAGRAGVFFGAAAAQDGVDPGQQFARVERLGEIVVGAHFQADDAVDFLGLGGQHDDGRVVVAAPQAAADGQAVLSGQHQVQHQEVEVFPLPELGHFLGVFGDVDVEALLGQITAQQIAQPGIIVDDEDLAGEGLGLRVHAENVTGSRKGFQRLSQQITQ